MKKKIVALLAAFVLLVTLSTVCFAEEKPAAAAVLSDFKSMTLEPQAYTQQYDMKADCATEIEFGSGYKIEYVKSSDDDTLYAGSTISGSVTQSGVKISVLRLPYIYGNKTATGKLYLNGNTEPYQEGILYNGLSGKYVSIPSNMNVTSYKFEVDEAVRTGSGLDAYVEIDRSITGNVPVDYTVEISLNKPDGVIAQTKTVSSNDKIGVNGFGTVNNILQFTPVGGDYGEYDISIFDDTHPIPKEITYAVSDFTSSIGSDVSMQTDGASLVSHTADEMILKKLVIKKGFASANSSYDVWLSDGRNIAQNMSVAEDAELNITNNEHVEFEIRFRDGTVLPTNKSQSKNFLQATYETKTDKNTKNLNNFLELKYNMQGKQYSTLDTANSGVRYSFMRKLTADNRPEQKTYTPSDDIVFDVSKLNMGKFNGDYSDLFFVMDDSISLENYYIKKIEISGLNGTRTKDVNFAIKDSAGNVKKSATIAKESKDAVLENTDTSVNSFSLTGGLYVSNQSISSDMLTAMSDYELADYVGNANMKDFNIKITCAPIPGKEVTKTSILDNDFTLKVYPDSRPDKIKIQQAVSKVTGTARIPIEGTLSLTQDVLDETGKSIFTNDDYVFTLKDADGNEQEITLNSSKDKNAAELALAPGTYTLVQKAVEGYTFQNYTVDGGVPVEENLATVIVKENKTVAVVFTNKKTAVPPESSEPESKPESGTESSKPESSGANSSKPDSSGTVSSKPDSTDSSGDVTLSVSTNSGTNSGTTGSNSNGSSTPKTGDSGVGVYGVVLLLSAAAAVVLIKRKNNVKK